MIWPRVSQIWFVDTTIIWGERCDGSDKSNEHPSLVLHEDCGYTRSYITSSRRTEYARYQAERGNERFGWFSPQETGLRNGFGADYSEAARKVEIPQHRNCIGTMAAERFQEFSKLHACYCRARWDM